LDALANASERLGAHALRLNERLPELVSRAGSCGPDRFAVGTRAVVAELAPKAEAATLADQRAQVALRRWSDTRSGTRHYHLRLDPETADRVDPQRDAEIERRWAAARTDVPDTTAATFASIGADAMVNRLTSTGEGSAVPAVVVIDDLETLQTDEPAGGAEHRGVGIGPALPVGASGSELPIRRRERTPRSPQRHGPARCRTKAAESPDPPSSLDAGARQRSSASSMSSMMSSATATT
jgi:hypothetical protein